MPLYPKNRRPFSLSLFKNPTAEYRGTPFWSWNNRLDLDQLVRQLEYFRRMGMGGAHLHCRTGLGTPYLGKEFLDIVRGVTEKAKDMQLLTWLYDEDRWPSGAAGGLVTKDARFRARHLLFTPTPYRRGAKNEAINTSSAHSGRAGVGTLLARYAVTLDRDGALASYRCLKKDENAKGQLWYAYLEVATPSAWYNDQTYVDTLNPAAIERFVQITHEAYKKAVGKHFGKDVPAIFTDEPQFSAKRMLARAEDLTDVILPWTDDLPATFAEAYGADLLAALPEVVWNLPANKPSVTRYRYHDHVAERFASAFADTIGSWCQKNGIALTGHMMSEPSLGSQTGALGEAMRSYRAFDIPGIDMLCDAQELTTAKQAQSACQQFGREGVMSELYGVTGWHFDFPGHKRQGDWQAALGVTVRVPHLAWVSMAGEAKRDYPAAIGYQSPWFEEYKHIEDHFARVNVALTRGRPVVRIGVIHPIESFWLCYGPHLQTRTERDQREAQFSQITEWLIRSTLDFNFISESLLPIQAIESSHSDVPTFQVGQMSYDVLLLPGMRTIRSTTLSRLESFVDRGGRVIFLGEIPSLVDAIPSDRPAALAARAQRIGFDRAALLDALASVRDITVESGAGAPWTDAGASADSFIYQLRQDGKKRILFLCTTDRDRGRTGTRIKIRGEWQLTLLDTFSGTRAPLAGEYVAGETRIVWDNPAAGSLLLELSPGRRTAGRQLREPALTQVARLEDPVPVTLSEPNVLLLDQAQWRLIPDGKSAGAWRPREELLRLDDAARDLLGIRRREGHMAQPWTDQKPDPVLGILELCFAVEADVPVRPSSLAIEDPEAIGISFDGRPVPSTVTGWWVDESIKTVPMPAFAPGSHELLLRIPMTRKRNIEWCYLLGDFGVNVFGSRARITRAVRRLSWGDWTRQGLPFYAGNVTYHCSVPDLAAGDHVLETPRFQAPVMTVQANGKRLATLATAPFRAELPHKLRRIDITAFGNRANAFGFLHNANPHLRWYGPDAWRSTGKDWAYEYQLRPMGITAAPIISRKVR